MGYYTGSEDKLQSLSTHGRFGEFNHQRKDWTSYTKRLREYLIANGLEETAKKKAVLLSIIGTETYQLMRNLTVLVKPTTKSFDQLLKLVEKHHNLAPFVNLQHFKFASPRQKPGESKSRNTTSATKATSVWAAKQPDKIITTRCTADDMPQMTCRRCRGTNHLATKC